MTDGITRITVEGFKSISEKQSIEIAPLTILAGANSSGKSSIMQPLLLLKQTNAVTFDPGPLLLSGGNVEFTSSDQFLSRSATRFSVEIAVPHLAFAVTFSKRSGSGLEILEESLKEARRTTTLRPEMSSSEIGHQLGVETKGTLSIQPQRFFLNVTGEGSVRSPMTWIAPWIDDVIHVPGLRGNRSRMSTVSAVGRSFPGTFDNYTASVILLWQKQERQSSHYADLNADLNEIGLAEKVSARQINEAAIELLVDTQFNIADVGFGVSQTLPVLVALRAASEGQLVYLEEPEIHLHPRAQVRLAEVIARAAKRGVRVVAETHSTLLLTAIQTLVAKGELKPDLVKLHWFQRDLSSGATKVTPASLDENGAFGDWPEDFDDVILKAESAYLDAVEGRQVL
ncbi:MAG TPA: DUF3696 domain-containing protein [Bryobacteraceae bacterium]|nr:DUF3696 domain-containing protein [Bryobacteraceae bacterium]